MGRVGHVGVFPGDNRVIDRAGWQCTERDLDNATQRCRRIADHTHRRRAGDRYRTVALCAPHYRLAGPEARRY